MNRPLLIRYWDWLVSCLRLDFGDSYITGKPVWSLLGPALLNTLKLTLVSSLLIILLSIALGVGCALREGKWLDLSVRSFSFLLTSMPSYWLAALMVWYFSVKLDLLPTSGMDGYGSYVLPVAVIVIGYAGIYFRIIRSSMLSNLNEDYVLYGRACGLSERSLTLQVLRNSLQVAVSVFGLPFRSSWEARSSWKIFSLGRVSERSLLIRFWGEISLSYKLTFWCWPLRSSCLTRHPTC